MLALLCALATPTAGAAELDVVATTTSMAVLARQVGGERVTVSTLAPPDRDAHYLQARPTMIRALRGAGLVVAVGADLEVGWLPAALRNAANPAVRRSQPGYFEAAAQVDLLDAGAPAHRSRGDVHPAGNPHVQLDPIRMGDVALALAGRMAGLDPAGEAGYRQRAEGFARRMAERVAGWRQQVKDAPGALLYHKDMDYLLARLEVPILGYIEPLPGVPPTARHIKALVDELRDREPGVILHRPFDSAAPVRRLSDTLGWPAAALPVDPPLGAGEAEYVALIERYVSVLR